MVTSALTIVAKYSTDVVKMSLGESRRQLFTKQSPLERGYVRMITLRVGHPCEGCIKEF